MKKKSLLSDCKNTLVGRKKTSFINFFIVFKVFMSSLAEARSVSRLAPTKKWESSLRLGDQFFGKRNEKNGVFFQPLLIFLAIAFTSPLTLAQPGEVHESLGMESKILKGEVGYSIFLPAGYQTSSRRYPVLYLLHGHGGNETDWVQLGEVAHTASSLMQSGKVPPMIIVMPDGQNTWYVDACKGKTNYEQMFFEEFIPFIESSYRANGDRNSRAISGLSMGGHGSLLYSFKHPDMFVACAAFSSGIFTDEEIENLDFGQYTYFFQDIFCVEKDGETRVTSNWTNNSLFEIAKNDPFKETKPVAIYMECGDDDFLYKGNSQFHILLRDLNIKHEYRVYDGKHDWDYWRAALSNGLLFIGNSFRQ